MNIIHLLIAGIIVMMFFLVCALSFRTLSPNHYIVPILWGEVFKAYVPDCLMYRKSRRSVQHPSGQTMIEMGGRRSILGLGLAFGPPPIRLYQVPATPIYMTIETPGIMLKHEGSHSPNVIVTVTIRLGFQLSPRLNEFLGTFPVIRNCGRYTNDLTDNLVIDCMRPRIEGVVQQAIRVTASKYDLRGSHSIMGAIATFQDQVCQLLGDSSSVFNSAGLLNQYGDPGPCAVSVSLHVTTIRVEGEATRKALGLPMQGTLTGEGEGLRLQQIAQRTGMTPAEILQLETLTKIKNVILFSYNPPEN